MSKHTTRELTAAAASGSLDQIQRIIEATEKSDGSEGVKAMLVPNFLNKALDKAAQGGHVSCAEYLLEKLREVAPEHVHTAASSALYETIKAGQSPLFKYFSTQLGERLIEALKDGGHLAFREAMQARHLAIAGSIAATIRGSEGEGAVDVMLATWDYQVVKVVAQQEDNNASMEFMQALTSNEDIKREITRIRTERPSFERRFDAYRPAAEMGAARR